MDNAFYDWMFNNPTVDVPVGEDYTPFNDTPDTYQEGATPEEYRSENILSDGDEAVESSETDSEPFSEKSDFNNFSPPPRSYSPSNGSVRSSDSSPADTIFSEDTSRTSNTRSDLRADSDISFDSYGFTFDSYDPASDSSSSVLSIVSVSVRDSDSSNRTDVKSNNSAFHSLLIVSIIFAIIIVFKKRYKHNE